MRKFLVTICAAALIIGTMPTMPTMAASEDVSDFDGDIIDNPFEEFTTEAPEETTTEAPEETTTEVASAIVITTQPKDTKVSNGEVARFTVVATGDSLTYQWAYSKNGGTSYTNISTGKSATLEVTAKTSLNGALYRCTIKDANGNVAYTTPAKLSLNVIITQQPVSTSTKVGETATFSITAEGDGLAYFWMYSKDGGTTWTGISNSTSSTLNVVGKANLDNAYYRCRVKDSAGKYVYSSAAKLSLVSDTAITQQPVSASAKDGETATFTVKATGNSLKYLWFVKKAGTTKWIAIGSATTDTFVYKMKGSLDGCTIKCRIKDEANKQFFTDEVTFTMIK